MADIELIIKIPEEMYQKIKETNMVIGGRRSGRRFDYILFNAVNTGTPLPKGHGDLIDRKLALSDDGLCEFHMYDDYVKMRNYLKSIPTIIEADKEQTE